MKYLHMLLLALLFPFAAQAVELVPSNLTVNVVITNDNGGTATSGTLTVDGNPVTAGNPNSMTAGSHTVAGSLTGYTVSYSGDCNSSGVVNSVDGVDNTCTVSFDDQPGTLTVYKHVINDDDGELSANAFDMEVTGVNPSQETFMGTEEGSTITLDAGDYSVDESDYIRGSEGTLHNYTKTLGEGCSGTIANGQTVSCTITNDDPESVIWVPTTSTVIVVKHVINDNEGTNSASDFRIYVEYGDESTTSVTGNEEGTAVVIDAGEYNVSESRSLGEEVRNTYETTYSEGCSGEIAPGATVTCTVTNNDPGRRTPPASSGGGAGGLPANNPAVGPNDSTSGFTPPTSNPSPSPTPNPAPAPAPGTPRVLGAEDVADVVLACRAEDPDAALINSSLEEILQALNAQRNLLDERVSDSLLTRILSTGTSDSDRQVIKNFLTYGPQALQHLGAGERAGVINSFEAIYHRLPKTDCDWVDALRIAKGLMPHVTSPEREKEVEATFRAIYKRAPDHAVAADHQTLMIMAYGLRPAVRDLAAERASIRVFRTVFGHSPRTASEWDAVRGITYGGLPRP